MIPSPFQFYLSHPTIGPVLKAFEEVMVSHAEKQKIPIRFEIPNNFPRSEVVRFIDVLTSIGWAKISQYNQDDKIVLEVSLS